MTKTILAFACCLSFGATAQKVVFTEPFSQKNLSISDGYFDAGDAGLIEDSITKEKLFIYAGKKEFSFFLLDEKWKTLKKFTKSANDKSIFDDAFQVEKFSRQDGKWQIVASSSSGYAVESVDFNSSTHQVGERLLEDIKPYTIPAFFSEGGIDYYIYMDKSENISIARFTDDLKVQKTRLNLVSDMPQAESKKYKTADLFRMLRPIFGAAPAYPQLTKQKVHFYVQPQHYAVLISSNEPVAELSYYDKSSGRKIKSELFSVEKYLPADAKKLNSSALLFENKIHVLAAYKDGGVYAVFDQDTKNLLYNYSYTASDKTPAFNFGPAKYETLPGTTSTSKLREKVENIDMDRFCTEMFKHSCALTAKKDDKGNLIVSLANYDMKQIAAATSTLRNGMNTMSSPDWYVSTSAGFIFEPGSFRAKTEKYTWNDVNNANVDARYASVDLDNEGYEFKHKKASIMSVSQIGTKGYVIYYYDKQIKVMEFANRK